MTKINAQTLLTELTNLHLENKVGSIIFNMAGISVKIDTTDTVGITLQFWLKQYLKSKNYFFSEPENTQEFPDFFLDDVNPKDNMLEVKAFNYQRSPAFDIANFESYCDSVKKNPYRLNADYLIFGYEMTTTGDITIKKIWLHKIWEIAGTSDKYPLKTQVKRGMVYNIRPASAFKNSKEKTFSSKDEFLKAIYKTLVLYKGQVFADSWKTELAKNYQTTFNSVLPF